MRLSNVVQAQRDFFLTDQTKSIEFRKEMLHRLAEAIEEYKPQIYQALQQDLHKSEYEAYLTEVSIVTNEIKEAIKNLDRWAAPTRVRSSLAVKPSKSMTIHEPYGVALILSPWNYPFQLAMCPLVGAMAAGNCVVLKPSRNSVHTTRVIEDMIHGNFEAHYLYVVEEEVTHDALLSEQYDYIFFTGSPRVGRIVMRAASEYLTPVTLELGGKSPCIVDKTADLKDAAKKIVWGKLLNAGQTCIAPDFLLVDEDVKEELVEELRRAIGELFGDPLANPDYPKIINLHHYMRLCGLIDREKNKVGGERDERTLRIAPAIFPEASYQSEVMKEEIFGPIIPVIGYGQIEAALEELKARPKPLACYIFTRNRKFGEKIIREYSFGGGCVNDCIMHYANAYLPFGGVGKSGMGQYHGYHSFCTFSHEKAILINRRIWDAPYRFPPFTAQKLESLHRLLKD